MPAVVKECSEQNEVQSTSKIFAMTVVFSLVTFFAFGGLYTHPGINKTPWFPPTTFGEKGKISPLLATVALIFRLLIFYPTNKT